MSDSVVTTSQLSLVPSTPVTANTHPANVSRTDERQNVAESGKISPQAALSDVTSEEVVEAVSDISDYVQNISRELQFKVDDELGRTIITVIDKETDEVVRQIPSEEIVAMARSIAENAPDPVRGLLMNGEG